MSKLIFVLAAIEIVAFVVDAVNQGMPQGPLLTGFAPAKHEAGFAPERQEADFAPEMREAAFAPEVKNTKTERATQDRGPQEPPRH
ncbi:hypothetical protein AAVH_29295 [Aphelenchoides avenae]|nr:hypothetical protein AAVH_29295 [Aphelenchus avenae]